ncbi:MAG: ABC transporter permease [Lachnospiraceae bacterium]|jgi:peptide/nickel transport system permease protein
MSSFEATAPILMKRKKRSMFRITCKRLARSPVAMIGLGILLILVLSAIAAPLIAPYSPTHMDYSAVFCKPCKEHIFGTDGLGRDQFSRMLYGGRYSLSLGFICSFIGMIWGVFFGDLVGYIGGKTDMIVMRIVDILSAIPQMLLAIIISTSMGAGFFNTILALTIGGLPGHLRGPRAMCLKERQMEYLEAAKAMNCSTAKIIYKHMMPNTLSPTIVGTAMGIGGSIESAAALAYIGLGVQPPTPEWGAMLAYGKGYILKYPHLIMWPGVIIAITVLATNMFGDGLRDAMDPRLKD